MTDGRTRLLLGLAASIGAALGGAIGWLTADVLAGLAGVGEGSGSDLMLVGGGLAVGAGIGGLVAMSSARRILSDGR